MAVTAWQQNSNSTFTLGMATSAFVDIRTEASIIINPKIPKPGSPGYGMHIMKRVKGDTALNVMMYCVKCRSKKLVPEAEKLRMRNGKPAIKGKCPDCSTGMYAIGEQYE